MPSGIEPLDKYLQEGFPKRELGFRSGRAGNREKHTLSSHSKYCTFKEYRSCNLCYDRANFQIFSSTSRAIWNEVNGYRKDGSLFIVDLFELRSHAYEKAKETNSKKRVIADPLDVNNLVDYLWTLVRGNKIREPLIIIDSLSAFWVDKPAMARRYTYNMKVRLAKMQPTVIATLQYAVTTGSLFGFGAEHIADGIIQLFFENIEKTRELRRWGIIKKMRLTNHYKKAWRFDIQLGKGFVILEK